MGLALRGTAEDGSGDRVNRFGGIGTADLVFAAAASLTAAYHYRLARRQFFVGDDWGAAARPGNLADLFEPYNSHLSVVPLVVYRSLFRVFAMEHYAPFRLLAITSFVALAIGLYVYVRQRLGPWPAVAVAMVVLWIDSMQLAPFLFNFHLALLLGVVCAAALPSRVDRADATIFVALGVALCTSAVGVAVAAACAVHSLLSGVRVRRWLAVGLPSAGWALWWATLGVHNRRASGSVRDGIRTALDGSFGSFEALAAGTFLGGAVLAVLSAGLLAWRVGHDRDAARMQLAWMAGLATWWIGLAWSRSDASSSFDTPRYAYVGAVFVLLSVIPPRPLPVVRAKAGRPAVAVVALCAVVAAVVANEASIRALARDRQTRSTWAANIIVEVGQGPQVVPDTQVLPQALYKMTAGEYRELVRRRGTVLTLPEDPDAYLIRRGAVIVEPIAPNPDSGGGCLDDPATLEVGSAFQLQTGDQPVNVSVRRFGPAPVPARTVSAGSTVRIRTWGPSVARKPWLVTAPGGCLVAIPPA